jgi:hypothetical protein
MGDKYYLNKWLDSLRLCRGSIPTVDHQLSNLVEWFELSSEGEIAVYTAILSFC